MWSADQLIEISAALSCLKELHGLRLIWLSPSFWAWNWMLGKRLQMDIMWKKTPLHWNAHTKQTPNVTHHSRIPWQWLIYLSCSWHMPQLESNFPQTSLFGSLLYFLAFQSGPAPTMLRITCIIAASGGFLITKHDIPVSRRMEQGNLGRGLWIARGRWAFSLNGSWYGMTFFWNCWKWPTIRAAGQNAEVTWSHSGFNGNSNTLSETTAIISDRILTMKCSKAVSGHAPTRSSSENKNITVRCGRNVSSADIMKSQWGISSCVTLLLQPGSWHETGSLSVPQPSQGAKHGTCASVCIVFSNETPRWLFIPQRSR